MKKVCEASAVKPGTPYTGIVGTTPIAIFQLGETYFAIEDACPHQYLPLSGGSIDGQDITCPFHGARFNLATGEVIEGPADCGIATFSVTQKDDALWIDIE